MGTWLRFKIRIEQRVHQGGLAETGLSDAQDVKHEPILDALADQLIRQTVKSNMTGQLQGARLVVLSKINKQRFC